MKVYENRELRILPFTGENFFKQYDVTTNYYCWFSNQLVTRYNDHGLTPMTDSDFKSFFAAIENKDVICGAIVDKKKNIHVGNVSLQSFNQINRSCELAIIIGEPSFWGKGIATRACAVMIYHAFNFLNIHRVWSGTGANNIGMQKVFNKLGFEQESVFRQAKFSNGKHVDILQYSLIRRDYDYLIDTDTLLSKIVNEFIIKGE